MNASRTGWMFISAAQRAILIAALLMIAGGCSLDKSPDKSPGEDAAAEAVPAKEVLSEDRPAPESAPEPESVICAECHENHVRLWEYGGHNTISCERCHGPAGAHTKADIDPRPAMPLGDDPTLCLSCHGRFKTRRPGKIPQIVGLAIHVKYVGEKHSVPTDVTKTGGKCTYCHDPHSME